MGVVICLEVLMKRREFPRSLLNLGSKDCQERVG
jgi:hypothetical protein